MIASGPMFYLSRKEAVQAIECVTACYCQLFAIYQLLGLVGFYAIKFLWQLRIEASLII